MSDAGDATLEGSGSRSVHVPTILHRVLKGVANPNLLYVYILHNWFTDIK